MRIETEHGTAELVNELMYSFGSADNTRVYAFSKNLAIQAEPTSIHGVLLNGRPIAVFGQDGGCSTVHAHSAVYENGHLYIAVGDSVVCIRPSPFAFKWAVQVDNATCFGIYYQSARSALISHGELEIARVSNDGAVLWSASGADVFSEGFSLLPACVEAIDFNGDVYHFDYESGLSCS